MKKLITLFVIILVSYQVQSQQILWAQSYDILNCNEVAASSTDAEGNIYISGVYDATYTVPYIGNCYLLKTTPNGQDMWTENFTGNMHIADMEAYDDYIILIGQSNGQFTYQEIDYGSYDHFLFVIRINSDGSLAWFYENEDNYGTYTNLAIGNQGNIALQFRGAGNLGDWVVIMDPDGNILNTKEIYAFASTIADISYYNNWVYLNGSFNGPGSIIIDTIVINLYEVEGVTFTVALDENLVAKWAFTDTTLVSLDGKIVSNGAGVFVYELELRPVFDLVQVIRKFNFDGELISQIDAPVFTNSIVLHPDMVITPNKLGLFSKSDNSSHSHSLYVLDHDLNLVDEKTISGPSSFYSGAITNYGDDFFIANIHSGELNFANEITLPYSGTGNNPYIAKYGADTISGLYNQNISLQDILIYPNPASENITIRFEETTNQEVILTIYSSEGKLIMQTSILRNNQSIDISSLSPGVYFANTISQNGSKIQKKLVVF